MAWRGSTCTETIMRHEIERQREREREREEEGSRLMLLLHTSIVYRLRDVRMGSCLPSAL
jgi:hypothetical protein